MAGLSLFESAAHRWGRARRWLLLGNAPPFLARYAPRDLPTPDPVADGKAAIRVWARWRVSEALENGLGTVSALRIQQGDRSLGIAGLLEALAEEPDRDAAATALRALSRAARASALELGSAWARATELAAERGAPEIAGDAETEAAKHLLSVTEEPVRDVLSWATRRNGRPRRAPVALGDVLRVLRSAALDEQFRPAENPWPALIAWREQLGLGAVSTEMAWKPEAWPGSWALRGKRSRLVGASGWPGAQRARFALQGLGRVDVLNEGGHAALLPQDAAAAQLLEAVYPMLLSEPGFVGRVFGSKMRYERSDADGARLAALAELLLQRLQAAAVRLWAAFDATREVGAVVDAAGMISQALYVTVPADLGILIAAPWSDGLGALPSTSLSAAALIADWREGFDEDFWRNPRFGESLRLLASRAPQVALTELVPEAQQRGPGAHARWTEANLGR